VPKPPLDEIKAPYKTALISIVELMSFQLLLLSRDPEHLNVSSALAVCLTAIRFNRG